MSEIVRRFMARTYQDAMLSEMARLQFYEVAHKIYAENESLRADAERYRWMKANVRNGSFGTDTGWIDDDTENWDDDLDIQRGVKTISSPENPS